MSAGIQTSHVITRRQTTCTYCALGASVFLVYCDPMTEVVESMFQCGDQVVVRWLGQDVSKSYWVPARVVRTDTDRPMGRHLETNIRLTWVEWEEYEAPRDVVVRASLSLPHPISVNNGTRMIPAGTPILYDFEPSDVRLLQRDHQWSPHHVKPFIDPSEYRLLGGSPGCPLLRSPGYTHVGGYLPSYWYQEGDPVWVWENGWRAATVISSSHRWIRVRYAGSFRDKRGNSGKGYRPPDVWAILCNHSSPNQHLTIEEQWIDNSRVCPETTRKIDEYPKYHFLATALKADPELADRLRGAATSVLEELRDRGLLDR